MKTALTVVLIIVFMVAAAAVYPHAPGASVVLALCAVCVGLEK